MKTPSNNQFYLNQDKYRKSNNHPSHKGAINIDGKIYWISGWYNVTSDNSYFKGEIRPVNDVDLEKYFSQKDEKVPPKSEHKPSSLPKMPIQVQDDDDDMLPF